MPEDAVCVTLARFRPPQANAPARFCPIKSAPIGRHSIAIKPLLLLFPTARTKNPITHSAMARFLLSVLVGELKAPIFVSQPFALSFVPAPPPNDAPAPPLRVGARGQSDQTRPCRRSRPRAPSRGGPDRGRAGAICRGGCRDGAAYAPRAVAADLPPTRVAGTAASGRRFLLLLFSSAHPALRGPLLSRSLGISDPALTLLSACPSPQNTNKNKSPTPPTAAYLLAAAATLPGALAARAHLRHMRRHLRQVDSSIRQETVAFRMVSALRKTGGDAAEAANSYGGDLGSQNFEKKASWRSYNNMLSTLGRVKY